ncbi:MAG TPA: ABC-2 family transporter protein [Acidimicrobiales bacterium]|nr:ABC-2 family transporter protein [Acidimicrobiales bacterium]
MRASFRQYRATAALAGSLGFGENALVLFGYVLRILQVLLLLSLWRALFADRGEVGGLQLSDVLTYTLLSTAFAAQLDARTNLDQAIWEGTVVRRLLRPVPLFGDFVAEMSGRWLFGLLSFTAPLLLLAPLLGVSVLPRSLEAGAFFVVSLLLAIAVGTALDFLFGSLIVWLDQSLWAVYYARLGVVVVLSGALVPLPLLPWGIGTVLSWLPFASMASAPLLIFLGQGDPLPLLAGQAFWAVFLWWAAVRVWRLSLPRMVAYGG